MLESCGTGQTKHLGSGQFEKNAVPKILNLNNRDRN